MKFFFLGLEPLSFGLGLGLETLSLESKTGFLCSTVSWNHIWKVVWYLFLRNLKKREQ